MPNSNHTVLQVLADILISNQGTVSGVENSGGSGGGLVAREDLLVVDPKTKTKKPPFYRVIMLNDDYTPMDFVVQVLKSVFRHPHEDAIRIMLEIHHRGAGVCGVFTRDVAETKVEIVLGMAKQNEYPLQCVMEKE
ncbi:MAG: ATP-dependent Clp protease adapter ClpS [Rickettsiales bacterium]|nr:ATP-dependent Clp protease adapter ClpS [Rickettsiales bacterium]